MFKNLLFSFSIRDLPPQTPICVSLDSTIISVFQTLRNNQILAVPVTDTNKYVGIVDSFSLLKYFVIKLDKQLIFEKNAPPKPEQLDKKILSHTLRDVFALSKEQNKTTSLPPSSSLSDVVRELTTTHRVVITDESGMVVRVISQSDIIRFVGAHLDPSFASKTLRALEISLSMHLLSSVVYVQHDCLAIEAVKVMVMNEISAVPVVKDDEIIGHFSSSDLDFSDENNSLNMLLSKVSDIAPLRGIINVNPSITIGEVLNIFITKKIHRIYIVEDFKQIGILSLSDVMNIVFST